MKKTGFKLLLIVVIQLVAINFTQLHAQNHAQKIKSDAVPEVVLDAFNSEYTGVKGISWMLENKLYVASFKDDGVNGKAVYNADGAWLRTGYDVPKDELPSAIGNFIVKEYGKDFSVTFACLEEMPDSPLHYYIEVKMTGVGMAAIRLTFDTEGKLLTRDEPEGLVTNSAPESKPDTKKNTSSGTTATTSSKQSGKTTAPTQPAQRTSGTSQNGVYSAKTTTVNTQPAATTNNTSSATKPTEPATTTTSTKTPVQTAKERVEKETPKPTKKEQKNIITDQYGNVALQLGQVPEVVIKALAKKTSSKEELNWFKIDTFYVAKCIVQSKKNEFFFTKNGTWARTLIILPEEGVTGNPAKHISTFYKGYKFVNAMKEQNPSKNDILMVEIYEKENIKQKLITTVLFDKTGKLIRTIDPDYQFDTKEEVSKKDEKLDKYYEKMNMNLQEDLSDGIPANIVAAFKAKYPKITAFTWERDADGNYVANWFGVKGKEACVIGQSANVLETHIMSDVNSIPATIQNYIKENYKNYKAIEFYNVKALLEKNNYYKVVVESKKTKATEILWFTTTGRFIDR